MTEGELGYVLGFAEIGSTHAPVVGGKAVHLAQLSRIDGVVVPAGFCVTTGAFAEAMAHAPVDGPLDRLSRSAPDDREAIRASSAELRRALERVAIPDDVADAVTRSLAGLGERAAYAVRSSATAEDLPTASFAGQHDSFLNVMGASAVLEHVRRCWASLFSERAVTYRARNGFDHRTVRMGVVVQRMVAPQAAGILFTADPVTGNRKVASVEAGFGLGEALVSGLANADVYKVRAGKVLPDAARRQDRPALTDRQAVRLVRLGRRIEAHFGCPQDIEWCLVGDDFQFVQSRPITTLFPIPEVSDRDNHVYLSVGHQQMMTDAMKPLGLSVWQLTTRRGMAEAGGRLFVDVSRALASPAGRAGLLSLAGRSDPLIGDALRTIIARGFIPSLPDADPAAAPAGGAPGPGETDPAVVAELIADSRASLAALRRDIAGESGSPLLDFILRDIRELQRILFDPRSHRAIMAGMEAAWWLNDQMQAWLGERNAADKIAQSVPDNVTSEMGLALLDVADAIRPHPQVVAFLERVDGAGADDGDFLDELAALAGGREACAAIRDYLDRYGMRCVGEIDITRPRWSERPVTLVPALLTNIKSAEPGAAGRRFQLGRAESRRKERELLERVRALPDGERKAEETKRVIDRIRAFAGYREYPKYGKVSRYFVYKQALLDEAHRLVHAGVLREAEDIFYLRFAELQDVVRTQRVDHRLIRERKAEHASYQALTPPRVLTSEGEAVAGTYRRHDLPAGVLPGLPVSTGTVEGRARIVLDMAQADLHAGDILVTAYTDPSWTPLFVAIKGLVTEVGGLMTHGSVIAREYGLPAVVGVEHATRLIEDGQPIRVHGTDGYVELLT